MQQNRRLFKFSDAKLKHFAELLKDNVTRDAQLFAARGITAAHLVTLQQHIDICRATSTDAELLGKVIAATEKKKLARKTLVRKIKVVRGIAYVACDGRGVYKTFGFEDVSRASYSNLVQMGLRVHRVATDFLAILQPHGLTATMLTELMSATKALDDITEVQAEKKNNRDIARQKRIDAGNALYMQVSRLVRIGKAIFLDEDEARYNDYLLPAVVTRKRKKHTKEVAAEDAA